MNLLFFRFEYFELIQQQAILYFLAWKTAFDFAFHKVTNKIFEKVTIIQQIFPNTSNWTKAATLTGVGLLGAGIYGAAETHVTRVATEKAAEAAVASAKAAVISAKVAERSADASEVQAGLMTKEEFLSKHKK